MLKHLLVPLDGSPTAEVALPYAEALARRSGAKLTLVRAANTPPFFGDRSLAYIRELAKAEDYLGAIARELSARGLRAETALPYGGVSAATWIVDEIAMRHTDMVVMSTHDRTGPDRWLHGSVAEAVVSQSTVPVMVVRDSDGMRAVECFSWDRPVLVVPLDGSDIAEAALPVASNLALSLGAQLMLVGVVPGPGQLVAGEAGMGAFFGKDHAQLVAAAREYLDIIDRRLTASGSMVTHMVRVGEPAAQIALTAHETTAGAVVMATHGWTGLLRTLVGSVAGKVLHYSPSPVVLMRPRQLGAISEPVTDKKLATLEA
jgi:nucleotide-binding universal stress UspA family protein